MLGNTKFGKIRKQMTGLLMAILMGTLLPVATVPQPLYAQDQEYGYFWSLAFDFNSGYDGLLTIEVGPWENGWMTEVEETSTAVVKCRPVGDVTLAGGSAVFKGGSIKCAMDIRQIVLNNHGMEIPEVDNYGSILMQTTINSAANTVAPIFTHQDAVYSIDFTNTSAVTLNQRLWNKAGQTQATFGGVTINTWQSYSALHSCIGTDGPCDTFFNAVGPQQTIPTPGHRAHWTTGLMSFEVGGAGFTGQMDSLLIDPGNSAH